ncbi:MAG: amino acid ABC transporter permease [Clostridia bacterium]
MELSFFGWIERLLNEYWPVFLRGTGITMLIAITGTIAGFLIGLLVGVVRTIELPAGASPITRGILKVVNFIIGAYVEVFRGTPMMVQAMVIFYGIAMTTGVQLNRTAAGILIVSINTGAYMAEIVRGGIIAIDRGQFEAAHAIGMTHWQTMKCVILPQAIRNILPATGNEFVINIKDTSVLNVISVTELFFQTKSAAGTYFRFFEAYTIAAVIYFVLTFTVTRLLKLIERKLDGPKNYTLEGAEAK